MMPLHSGELSSPEKLVLKDLTKNMHMAYDITMGKKEREPMQDYTPYSCQKIISSAPGVGDHHGCPYRHFSEENLRAALTRMRVGNRALEDVIDKVRNRHYQLACTLTFEAVHGSSCDAGVNHPNQYYNDSQRILESQNSSSNPQGTTASM